MAILAFFTLFLGGVGIADSGPMATASLFLGGRDRSLPGAALRVPDPPPAPGGPRAGSRRHPGHESPVLLAVGLLAALAALLISVGIYAYVAVTDIDQIEAPGMTLVAILAALP